MTPKELKTKYPKILRCSLDIGEGWFWLLDQLCQQLTFDIEHNDYPQIKFSTVKEKFGFLRIYTSYPTTHLKRSDTYDTQRGAIRLVESMSASTCEICGDTKTAKIRDLDWKKCLCDDCEESQ